MKMTKKKVLWIGLVGICTPFLLQFLYSHDFYVTRNMNNFGDSLFYISFPIFLFSLITYKLREEVFRSWLHFAYWWMPFEILFVLGSMGGGGGFGMHSFGGEDVAMILSVLFFAISLVIIVARSLMLRGK